MNITLKKMIKPKFDLAFFGIIILLNCIISTNAACENNSSKDLLLDRITVIDEQASQSTLTGFSINTESHLPYTDAGDFFREAPGISAGRFGGHGLELYIRGQAQNQINVIADDAFIFGGCPNRMDPPSAYLNLMSFDEVIASTGYQSLLNSFGGSGGSIILKRNKPNFGEEIDYKTKFNSGYNANGDLFNAGASTVAGNNKSYIKLYSSYKDSGNYEDGNGDTVRSSFKENSAGLAFGLTPKNDHFNLSYDFHNIRDALFPGAGMDSPLSEGHTIRSSFTSNLSNDFIKEFKVSSYASLVDHEMDNFSLRKAGRMLRKVESKSNTYGLKMDTDWSFNTKTSIEFRRKDRDAQRLQGSSPSSIQSLQSIMWPDISTNEIGISSESNFNVFKDTTLVLGGRYDYVNVDYNKADKLSDTDSLSANDIYKQFYGYESSTVQEHNISGLLRLEYQLNPSSVLFSGFSHSVRTADETERGLANYMVMQGENRSWVGNPKLDPEKHRQFDLGIFSQAENYSFKTNAYINSVKDYIFRDSARAQDGIIVNAPSADVYRNIDVLLYGLELSTSYELSPEIFVSSNATYTYGDNKDDSIALAQVPPLQGSLALSWLFTNYMELKTNLRWAFQQNRVDLDPLSGSGRDTRQTPGYALLDLSLASVNIEPFDIVFGVSNVLDQNYANHLNRSNISDPENLQVNEPGRSVFVEVRFVN